MRYLKIRIFKRAQIKIRKQLTGSILVGYNAIFCEKDEHLNLTSIEGERVKRMGRS